MLSADLRKNENLNHPRPNQPGGDADEHFDPIERLRNCNQIFKQLRVRLRNVLIAQANQWNECVVDPLEQRTLLSKVPLGRLRNPSTSTPISHEPTQLKEAETFITSPTELMNHIKKPLNRIKLFDDDYSDVADKQYNFDAIIEEPEDAEIQPVDDFDDKPIGRLNSNIFKHALGIFDDDYPDDANKAATRQNDFDTFLYDHEHGHEEPEPDNDLKCEPIRLLKNVSGRVKTDPHVNLTI